MTSLNLRVDTLSVWDMIAIRKGATWIATVLEIFLEMRLREDTKQMESRLESRTDRVGARLIRNTSYVRGQTKVRKRMLVRAPTFSLGHLLRKRFHVGTIVRYIFRHFQPHFGPFAWIVDSSGCKTRGWPKFTTAWLLAPFPHPAHWKPVSSTGC